LICFFFFFFFFFDGRAFDFDFVARVVG